MSGITTLQLPFPNTACTNRCVEEHELYLAHHTRALREAEDGWRTRAQWIVAYEAHVTHSQQRIQQLQSELDTLNSRIQRLEEAQRDVSREYDGVRERIKERILASEVEKMDNPELKTTPDQETIDEEEKEDEMLDVENSDNKTTVIENHLQGNSIEAQSTTKTTSDIPSQETVTTPSSPPASSSQTVHQPPHEERPITQSPPLSAVVENITSSKSTNELIDAEKKKREEEKRIQEREEHIKRLVDQHPDITRLQEGTNLSVFLYFSSSHSHSHSHLHPLHFKLSMCVSSLSFMSVLSIALFCVSSLYISFRNPVNSLRMMINI
jgi:predicted transcriptional regulator